MKPKEIFGVVLRFIGLVGLLYTCRHIYIMIHKTGTWHLGWLLSNWDTSGKDHWGELRAFVLEIVLILFGIYLLQGAPKLMKFMYPEEKKDTSDQGTKPQG